ncbi:hypothetical protein [Nocardia sp. NBC_00511]|uniref:Rv0361 family membrane protein n=1 Tax=Nocardia sp. NBC_00511 TaxID=2903591 RepID=UPI0030E2DE78
MSDVEETPAEIDQGDNRSMWPFLVAAGLIVFVVLGIVIATLVSPVEKNVTDSDRLSLVATRFIAVADGTDKSGESYACKDFDANRSPLRVAQATGRQITFDKLTDAAVDGDKATAQVSFTVDGLQSTSTWHFTRADSAWSVCN